MKRRSLNGIEKRILALILTVQVIGLCCVFSACATAQAQSSSAPAEAVTQPSEGSRVMSTNNSIGVMTRSRWLRDLMTALGMIDSGTAPCDYASVFNAAYEAGITETAEINPNIVLTRAYVADTLYRTLGYSPHKADPVADLGEDDTAMMTAVYYGWFIPDDSDMVYPDAAVTDRDYADLTAQLNCYAAMKGKRLISFGDSIMYGTGNDGEGITDMIAGKYGMTASDYAVSGATFGEYQNRSHIPDQVREAVKKQDPADIIFINGGTNDAVLCSQGVKSAGFNLTMFDESTFAGGMETALSLIRSYWKDVPVLYVRAHNMALCEDDIERLFGEYALEIADKWSVDMADIYNDTAFNAEDESIRSKYTFYREQHKRSDSIHPTALGYAKFYLPLITDQLTAANTGESD